MPRAVRLLDVRESSCVPQTSKLFDRRRRVAAKVVVSVGVDQHTALSDLFAIVHPASKFACAINDGLVPYRRLLLDNFPVTEPADVWIPRDAWIKTTGREQFRSLWRTKKLPDIAKPQRLEASLFPE